MQMDFPDKWAAIVWMCRNQLGRRNVTREQRDYLLSQEYEAQCKTVGGDGSNQYEKKEQLDESHQIAKENTRAAIAKSHNISQYEVQKAVEFGRGLDAAEKVSPGIKEAVLSGAVKAPKSVISEIRNAPEEQKSYLRGKQYEAEKMAQGGTGANQYTAEQSGQNVQSASRREIKDGTARRIGKQYGVNGRTGENVFMFLKIFPDKSLWKCAVTKGAHRGR